MAWRDAEAIPKIVAHDTAVVMHNDAVVQGLSELPHMTDISHWGVFTPIFYSWSGRRWRKPLILLELRGHFCENVVPRL
jgi:hypothetical protein